MQTSTENLLPPPVRRYLAVLAARQRRLSLLRAAGVSLAWLVAHALIFCLIDRLLRLPGQFRLISLLAGAGVALWLVARPLGRWVRGATDWVATSVLAERCDPGWGQRLTTATSRMLGPRQYAGSDALLQQVTAAITARAAEKDPQPLLPVRLALGPWMLATLLVAVALAAMPFDWLNLPRLLGRYALPLSPISPVTSTRLTVSPGSLRVPQGEPLTIRTVARRLGDAPPRLHLSADGTSWSQHAMVPADGAWIHRLDPLGSDLRYFVTGGDATSATYDVAVLRKPLVSEFRVRYVYPGYTRRAELTVTNRTGLIEAPAGTRATLTIVATEPIVSAALLIDGDALDTADALDPHVRQARFTIDRNATYRVRLTSDRGVVHELGGFALRALPDRPPLVRLHDTGQGQRPGPRDLMTIAYQALDDYGLEDVAVLLRVNGGAPISIGLKIDGDARRQEQTYAVDLAPLNANVGDVVAVSVAARDGLGQRAESAPVNALVSPRAIDLNDHGRIAELSAARLFAEQLTSVWERARRASESVGNAPPRGVEATAAGAELQRALVSAGESAAMLRQSLLRATLRSRSHEMSVTLAAALDAAQLQLRASEGLIGMRGNADRAEVRRIVDRAQDGARQLRDLLATVALGERAAAALAERENVAAALARAEAADYPAVLRKGVERMRDEFAQALKAIDIDPAAGDVPQQLQRRVDAGEAVMAQQRPIDFAKLSEDWATEISAEHAPTGFEDRLMLGAQGESIRPDADLLRARDIHVSAEAAARIEGNEVPPTTQPTDPLPRELYPAAMLALQRFHETNRPMPDRPSSDEVAVRARVATEGRRRMAAWAGLSNVDVRSQAVQATDATDDAEPSPEALAIEANAAAAERDYATASRIDRGLASAASGASESRTAAAPAQRTMVTAERIDQLAAEQRALAEETNAAALSAAEPLAERQAKLAGEIADVRQAVRPEVRGAADPDWREEATAAIQAAQEQLAAIPQALSRLSRADVLRREADQRAAEANRQIEATVPDQQPAARRAAAQAERDRDAAIAATTQAAQPVLPAVAETLSARLAAFRPVTADSVREMDSHLLPALRALAQSTGGPDAAGFDRAADQTRAAIERVQAVLQAAQESLIERDPLVAARWFARAATRSLSLRPPDLIAAERQQRAASTALDRAWQRSIHRAAGERLAGVPSLSGVFRLFPVNLGDGPVTGDGGAGALSDRLRSLVPAVRQWGTLRDRETTDTTAARRDLDAPGYDEPVRLYFEALGKAGGEPPK